MRTKKTLTTKLVLTAVLLMLTSVTASATNFITDVKVIGGPTLKDDVNPLWYDLVGKGWTGVSYNLNRDAGGDFIYLLYKTASNTGGLNFGEFITDFYIKMGADNVNPTLTHDGRTYRLVPYDGSDHFKNQKGDLNSGTGESTPSIHLYYTTDLFPDYHAITDISFNETSDGAVGEDGGSTACDLNKGCGTNSAYIYMHITPATAMPFSGMGTADNPFLIGSADEWDRFAAYVDQGQFADMCYQLTENISTSTMVGTSEHPFSGTFDGNGKSLSVTINSDEQYAAPFHYINAATIKNLTVGGTITSSAYYAAGLVGICSGSTNTISGCNVTANVAGSGYAGGIVGHGGTSTLIIDNCVYSGTISGFNQVAGGILGWCNGMTLTMRNNCLFVGTFSPANGGAYHPIACCYDSDHTVNATFTSTYYMNTLTPTAYCFNESNFNKVSTTYVNNVWNIAVTAVNGITYYAKTPGVALPYSYGFEASLNAEGWTLVNGVTSTTIATSDTDFPAHEGSHYLYVSNNDQTTQYLIAPEFKGDTPMTMTFWQKIVLDEPRFQVGYSTKPKPDVTADGDFVWDNEKTASANWTKEERTFPAGTKFVAIRFLPGTIQICCFDDFSFTVCDYPAPVNLVVSALTDNTATLSWEAPNTTASISTYTCEYKKDGDADWTALATQTGNTYTLSGLTGLTAYNFRVKANYDVGGESIYQPISFTTLMSLPYECGFENGMLGWGQVDINWGFTGITTDIAHDGTHSYVFELHIPENKKDQYLISPPMCTTSSKTVSFYFRTSIAASETFFVGFSTDNINFVAVEKITTDETQWQFYTCTIPAYARCLIIKYTSNSQNLYFDDFSIMEYSDKARPTGLAVSSLTTQSATVSWTAPTGATGYAYQYRKVGDDAWSAEAQVTATTVTLTGLSVNTFYNFRVKALYGSDASNFEPIGFQTEDNAVSLPYEAPFGDGDMGGWRMVDCDGNTGITSYCFRFAQSFQHSQYLISPELECSMDMFMIFSYTTGSENEADTSRFRVGYSTTTKDLSAFTWGETITAGIDEKTFTAVFPQETKYVAIEKLAGGHLLFTGQIDFEGRHVSVTLTKEGYGTYFRNYSDFVLPAGVKAHIVTGMNDDNTLNYETVADGSTSNNTVPAMTAVLLQTTPSSGQQTIVVTLDCPTKEPITETNLMHAWNRYSPTSGDGYHYKLNYDANGENLGWYWGAENGEAFEIAPYKAWLVLPRTAPAFISLTGDVTTYNITYDLAGGALAAGVTNPTAYTPESDAITLNNPTRTGYTFAGWTGTGLDAATMSVTIAAGSTGDRSYTATWTPNTYTVNFNKNAEDATGTMEAQDFTYDEDAKALTACNFARTNYDFAGWNTVATPTTENPGTAYTDGQNVQNLTTENGVTVTLYAQWTRISAVTVTQDENGYSVTVDESIGSGGVISSTVLDANGEVTVASLTYNRELSAPTETNNDKTIDGQPAKLYTTCMPTDPTASTADSNVKYYTLSSVSGSTLHFSEIDGAPQSNTPYLVAVFSGTVNEGTGSTPATGVTLKKEADNIFSADGYTMKGTLTGLTNAEAAAAGAYILQTGGKWSKVTSDTEEHRKAYIPPFRAYIVASSGARMMNSSFDDATGIDSLRLIDSDGTERWYDLSGRRIEKPNRKGVYIRNGKKTTTNYTN